MKNITITIPEDAIISVRKEGSELEAAPARNELAIPAPAPEELIVIRFRDWVKVISGPRERANAFVMLFERIDEVDSNALHTLYGDAAENTMRKRKCLGKSIDEVYFKNSAAVEDRKKRCAQLTCGLYLYTNVGIDEILGILKRFCNANELTLGKDVDFALYMKQC